MGLASTRYHECYHPDQGEDLRDQGIHQYAVWVLRELALEHGPEIAEREDRCLRQPVSRLACIAHFEPATRDASMKHWVL